MHDDRMDTGSNGDGDNERPTLIQRMNEALAVIQPDRARRKREEEEKRARTTYREDINLRQKEKVRYGNLHNAYSDNEGVEYDPKKDETIFDDKRITKLSENQLKRRALNAANHKREKEANTEILPDDPNRPFITFVIPSPNGKKTLADLASQHSTHINVWMTLNNVDNSTPDKGDGDQQKSPEDSGDLKKAAFPWARYLRSGKILQPSTAPMIKRRKRGEPDMYGMVSDDYRPIEQQYKDRCTKRPRIEQDREPNEREIFANLGKPIPILMPADLKTSNPPVPPGRMDWQPDTNTARKISTDIVRAQSSTLVRHGATRDTAIQIHDSASEAESSHRRPMTRVRNLPKPICLPRETARLELQRRLRIDDDSDSDSDTTSNSKNNEDEDLIHQISTAFANPIDFRYTGSTCEFCQDYRFPIFGYGRKQVTVARNPDDPDKMIELGNGHSATHAPNKMCWFCVGSRLMIMRCKPHTFTRIVLPTSLSSTAPAAPASSSETNTDNLEAQYITHLFAWEEARDNPSQEKCVKPPFLPPCSLCLHPATHACRSFQHYSRNLRPCLIPVYGSNPDVPLRYTQMPHVDKNITAQNPIRGCGLRLCQGCFVGMQKIDFRFEDVEEVAEVTGLKSANGNEEGGSEGGRRADLELLFATGELKKMFRVVQAMFREGE